MTQPRLCHLGSNDEVVFLVGVFPLSTYGSWRIPTRIGVELLYEIANFGSGGLFLRPDSFLVRTGT